MPAIPRPLKILVIDDNKIFIREVEARLVKAGFLVTTVFDAISGLALFNKEPFDLIFVDLVMPNMTGFEFIKEVRSRNTKVPIAVLSLLGQEEDVKRAQEAGADQYFLKKSVTCLDDIAAYAEKLSVA